MSTRLHKTACVPLLVIAVWPGPLSASRHGPGTVRILQDRLTGEYGLRADRASLERIATALGTQCGAVVEIDPPLREKRLTLSLSARPPERLFSVLARRAGARMTVAFRLAARSDGARSRPGPKVFAREPVRTTAAGMMPLVEALSVLALNVEVEEGVDGPVRLPAPGRPLGLVLDRLAAQVRGMWQPVIHFEAHRSIDPEAAAYERMHSHLVELARLPSDERLEEIRADLEAIAVLPATERAIAVERIRRDIMSLADYLAESPGEHRRFAGGRVLAIARDYEVALATTRRAAWMEPLREALGALAVRLEGIK